MIDLNALPADIEAIIFDCDGTLVDTAPVYSLAWAAGLRSSGKEMAAEWYRVRAGMSENVLMDSFEVEKGVRLDRETVIAIMRAAFLEEVRHVREIKLIADIARRNQCHLPMAVASGGPAAIVLPSLKAAALLPLFDAIVTFDDVGRAKPEPDIFLEAARRLSVRPAGCLVFEDSRGGSRRRCAPECDRSTSRPYLQGRAAGWQASHKSGFDARFGATNRPTNYGHRAHHGDGGRGTCEAGVQRVHRRGRGASRQK